MASGALAVSLIAACGKTDGVAPGGRAACEFGGALADCPDADRTPDAACWRLVDCGRIPVEAPDTQFDWGQCVDNIETMVDDRQRPVIDCIAASTCDELRTSDYCLDFGSR